MTTRKQSASSVSAEIESLSPGELRRIRGSIMAQDPLSSNPVRRYVEPPDVDEAIVDEILVTKGLLGEQTPVMTLTGKKGLGRWVTPAGVRVYLLDRRDSVVRSGGAA